MSDWLNITSCKFGWILMGCHNHIGCGYSCGHLRSDGFCCGWPFSQTAAVFYVSFCNGFANHGTFFHNQPALHIKCINSGARY